MVLQNFVKSFFTESRDFQVPDAPEKPNIGNSKDVSEEMDKLLMKARKAQQVLESYSQDQIDRLIKAIVYSVCQDAIARKISELAVEESKMGNFDGKYGKMFHKTRAALFDIIHDKSVGVIETDIKNNIIKIAKPMGVIFAVVPCTNPEATPVIKAINAIKGRNAIIVSANSKTVYVNEYIVAKMRLALIKMNAPQDLIQAVESPCRSKTKYLLENSDFNLVTGANSIVKAAYKSGIPSLGVGVGNAVIFVGLAATETKRIEQAAQNIMKSKTFDFAASCSADNSVICLKENVELLLHHLSSKGGHILEQESDVKKLTNTIFDLSQDKIKFRKEAIVKSAKTIAKLAEIRVPSDTKFLIVKRARKQVGPAYPLSGEKLSPVLTVYVVNDITQAIDLTNDIHNYQGKGHSCGIYSDSDSDILQFSLKTKTARVMVNQPQSLSNSGNLWNGMPQTLSLGCGTWGGNSSTENINWKNLVNVTYVSKPLLQNKVVPCDKELFGEDIIRLLQEDDEDA